MADPHDTEGARPTHIHVEKNKQPGWLRALAWVALIAGILALLLDLSRCGRSDTAAVVPVTNEATVAPAPQNDVVAATPHAAGSAALTGTSGLGAYLASKEAAPRSFQFETLTFDTAKSNIRPADEAEVDRIAGVLKQYGTAHVRIAGYADARGSSAANTALGKVRAEAVKAALVAQGIAADRIETASGGETDAVATNATTAGQAENRRTEVLITSRKHPSRREHYVQHHHCHVRQPRRCRRR